MYNRRNKACEGTITREQLTLVLVERMGLLLVLTFILTHIPLFRQLLDREIRFHLAFKCMSLILKQLCMP
ncbi:hypothetical protein C4A77_09785 [Brevibacillus laterosporus]|uniref:Uncharacterized protein n=1 Tax=Brevibacillus laterosporus TaxID=1465 RepID=A0AAP8U5B6_BRELA|nr:hypothetical protein C4A77_09785 [Brevibacillus laterosporus]